LPNLCITSPLIGCSSLPVFASSADGVCFLSFQDPKITSATKKQQWQWPRKRQLEAVSARDDPTQTKQAAKARWGSTTPIETTSTVKQPTSAPRRRGVTVPVAQATSGDEQAACEEQGTGEERGEECAASRKLNLVNQYINTDDDTDDTASLKMLSVNVAPVNYQYYSEKSTEIKLRCDSCTFTSSTFSCDRSTDCVKAGFDVMQHLSHSRLQRTGVWVCCTGEVLCSDGPASLVCQRTRTGKIHSSLRMFQFTVCVNVYSPFDFASTCIQKISNVNVSCYHIVSGKYCS
jgi:hypothetical protein